MNIDPESKRCQEETLEVTRGESAAELAVQRRLLM